MGGSVWIKVAVRFLRVNACLHSQWFTCTESFESISELYFKDNFTFIEPKSLAWDSGFVVYIFNKNGGTFGHLPLS